MILKVLLWYIQGVLTLTDNCKVDTAANAYHTPGDRHDRSSCSASHVLTLNS